MPAADPPFALALPSDLRLLPLARAFVEAACLSLGGDRSVCEAVLLAVNEALQNVIRHAHGDRPDATVQIMCRPVSEGIAIVVLDEGTPFDVTAVPTLDPAEVRIGGRGVYLMRKLMDELVCAPRPGGGNQLCLVKRFGSDCRRPRAG